MKAKEAPEKIYVPTTGDELHYHMACPNNEFQESVEYTRADAFIEKACDWLSDNLQTIVDVDCPSEHHVESIPVLGSITQTEFLRKFREEIKYLFD